MHTPVATGFVRKTGQNTYGHNSHFVRFPVDAPDSVCKRVTRPDDHRSHGRGLAAAATTPFARVTLALRGSRSDRRGPLAHRSDPATRASAHAQGMPAPAHTPVPADPGHLR